MESGKTQLETGRRAEQLAELYLGKQGLRLRKRNYRCRGGEIDLIMEHGNTLVFVEVRYRTHRTFGGAVESIDRRKQQRLIHAAQHYLQRHQDDVPCRFDVIAISPGKGTQPHLQWITNAIEVS